MNRRIVFFILILCFVFFSFFMPTNALGNFEYKISSTTTAPIFGSEFEVVISLTNYADIEDEIRGLQIDVTNIDSNVFEIISDTTMIDDPSAASNMTSNSVDSGYIRLLYFKFSGVMDKSVTDVMKFRLKVKSDLLESGTITLPITFRIVTLAKDEITLTDSLTISYQSDVVQVSVSWGSMEFVYEDGTWDKKLHKWINGIWKPIGEDSNLIKISNSGNESINVNFIYTPLTSFEAISGLFFDDLNAQITNPITIEAFGLEQKFWLQLYGTTESRWTEDFIAIGTVTINII